MENLSAQIQELMSLLPKLPEGKLSFACSLINQFNRKQTLSENQTPWVTSLLALAKGEKPEVKTVEIGSLAGLIALFKTAGAKLKYPKIRLQVNDEPLVLSLAGDRSKAPGSINVAGAGSFDNRAWYGRVSPDGRFDGSRSLTPEFSAALVPVLTELATDPAAAVLRYGKLTGQCMFCALPLTDERSLAAGCGETCAKHYGLHEQWKRALKCSCGSAVATGSHRCADCADQLAFAQAS